MAVRCRELRRVIEENGLEEGDTLGAFALSADRLRPLLAGYVRHRMGVKDKEGIEDIVGRTMVKIVEEIRSGREISALIGFARTVARAQAGKYIMAEQRQNRINEALADYPLVDEYTQSAEQVVIGLEDELKKETRLRIMRQVIEELDDEIGQKIIRLRLQGLLLKEIAPRLGLSLSATRARYWRLLERLRKRILAREAELSAELPLRLYGEEESRPEHTCHDQAPDAESLEQRVRQVAQEDDPVIAFPVDDELETIPWAEAQAA